MFQHKVNFLEHRVQVFDIMLTFYAPEIDIQVGLKALCLIDFFKMLFA